MERVDLRCVAVGNRGAAAGSSDRPSAVAGGRGEAQREGRQAHTLLIHLCEEQRLSNTVKRLHSSKIKRARMWEGDSHPPKGQAGVVSSNRCVASLSLSSFTHRLGPSSQETPSEDTWKVLCFSHHCKHLEIPNLSPFLSVCKVII